MEAPMPLQVRGICRITVEHQGESKTFNIVQSPMVDRHEAAEYVGVGINAFNSLVREGAIAKRGSGNRCYHIDDLDAYLDSLPTNL
jgi:hypothetical protein